jgi:hypothetical protein
MDAFVTRLSASGVGCFLARGDVEVNACGNEEENPRAICTLQRYRKRHCFRRGAIRIVRSGRFDDIAAVVRESTFAMWLWSRRKFGVRMKGSESVHADSRDPQNGRRPPFQTGEDDCNEN